LTTFKKLSNLELELRFDNFRKVVKSFFRNLWFGFRFDNFRKVVKSGTRTKIWQLSKSCQIWNSN